MKTRNLPPSKLEVCPKRSLLSGAARRRLGILGLLLLVTAPLQAAPRIGSPAPRFDFGERSNTEKVIHEFVITNSGDADLVITRTKTSCGCTVAQITNKLLPPGTSTTVKATLDLRNRRGKQTKSISVYCNDSTRPVYLLTLTGTAIADINITPANLFLGNANMGDTFTRSIKITTNPARPDVSFNVTKVMSARKLIETELKVIEAGKTYEILVHYTAKGKTGHMIDNVLIYTDLASTKVLSVPVRAVVQDKITIMPSPFALIQGDSPTTRYLLIRPGGIKTFQVLTAIFPDPDVETKILSNGPHGVRVQFRNLVPRTDLNGKNIILTTDVPGREHISIPITIRRAGVPGVPPPRIPTPPSAPRPATPEMVQDKITIIPSPFALIQGISPTTRYLLIRPGGIKTFQVLTAVFPDPDVETQILSNGPLGVRVQFRNLVPRPDLNGKNIILTTDVPGRERISIPITIRRAGVPGVPPPRIPTPPTAPRPATPEKTPAAGIE